ncbi:hypothetical protein, partial [Neobacillus fumarioli]|uniref:hypothetical protein n=1 Tax=Neobacillus fumarioli TaxID=105229 RepID=UPI001C3F3D19
TNADVTKVLNKSKGIVIPFINKKRPSTVVCTVPVDTPFKRSLYGSIRFNFPFFQFTSPLLTKIDIFCFSS